MRALSLWQPWASAIAVGAKVFETRHWSTNYRGPLAIHSAKRWARGQRETAHSLCGSLASLPEELATKPVLGAVVAVAQLVACHEMTEQMVRDCLSAHEDPTYDELEDPDPGQLSFNTSEFALGGWTVGRFAWELRDVRPLRVPFLLKGRQGLWTLGPDDEADVREAVLS